MLIYSNWIYLSGCGIGGLHLVAVIEPPGNATNLTKPYWAKMGPFAGFMTLFFHLVIGSPLVSTDCIILVTNIPIIIVPILKSRPWMERL
jgi:hypothetical protein